MINNKRLLWGASAAIALIAAVIAFVGMRRRRLAARTPTQRAKAAATELLKSVEEGAEQAAKAVQENAQQLAQESGRRIEAARDEIKKRRNS